MVTAKLRSSPLHWREAANQQERGQAAIIAAEEGSQSAWRGLFREGPRGGDRGAEQHGEEEPDETGDRPSHCAKPLRVGGLEVKQAGLVPDERTGQQGWSPGKRGECKGWAGVGHSLSA